MKRSLAFCALLALVAAQRLFAQVDTTTLSRGSFVEKVLRTSGLAWDADTADHFIVHTQRGVRFVVQRRAMLDSLEIAWTNAEQILGATVPDVERIPVFVITSPKELPQLMKPPMRGLTFYARGGPLVVIVHNDSVKPYTRHEVMHVVSSYTWGTRADSANAWMIEALGVLADGVCQGVPNTVAARDIMRWSPNKTAFDFTTRFIESTRVDRAGTYVLAGSMLAYLWEKEGRDGVHAMWPSRVTPKSSPSPLSASTLRDGVTSLHTTGGSFFDDPTPAWRAWVLRTAGDKPGLDSASYRRYGCK
jgi:hypothetical protein